MIYILGGNGKTFDSAIKILGAEDETDGFAVEFQIISYLFGDQYNQWELFNQHLINFGNKHFDILEIELFDGKREKLFFDITDFFGKIDLKQFSNWNLKNIHIN